jgi:uncharacterized protein YutE (UPF0331/DUF86 family)
LPEGSSWHTNLLERMNLKLPSIRKQVIDEHLKKELYDYLRFRHIFRHVYGFDLDWNKMEHLVRKIEEIYEEFRLNIKNFLLFLDKIEKKI